MSGPSILSHKQLSWSIIHIQVFMAIQLLELEQAHAHLDGEQAVGVQAGSLEL